VNVRAHSVGSHRAGLHNHVNLGVGVDLVQILKGGEKQDLIANPARDESQYAHRDGVS
jgi:hypothetical protein